MSLSSSFPFYGTSYSDMFVNMNGSITFTAGDPDPTATASEMLAGNPRIAPAWDDWDPSDVFVELKNESARPVNVSGWHLILEGVKAITWRIPSSELEIPVGGHVFLAAKDSGCFPEPDWVVPTLAFSYGEPFRLTLRDADERLMEPAGSRDAPPSAGGYDRRVSRSMEKVALMFGGRGTEPHSWHFYTNAEVDVPNDDRMLAGCRVRTGASPGRPNSPDYSGAFASGDFQ